MNRDRKTAKHASEVGQYSDLKGKSVFITGGGSGIGAALTEAFIERGAHVAFVQRSDASAFCKAIEERCGARPFSFACDITDIAALQIAMGTAQEHQGPIDILVNNAANDQRHRTEDVDEAFWDKSMAINLKAYFFACQAVIEPDEVKRRRHDHQLFLRCLHGGHGRFSSLHIIECCNRIAYTKPCPRIRQGRYSCECTCPGYGDYTAPNGPLANRREHFKSACKPMLARSSCTRRHCGSGYVPSLSCEQDDDGADTDRRRWIHCARLNTRPMPLRLVPGRWHKVPRRVRASHL